MSGPIIFGESLVTLPSARIAKKDVAVFQSSADLLARAQRIRHEAEAASEAARVQGYKAGQESARAEFADALSGALAELSNGFSKENTRREREVAAAAIEVVSQLIGRRDPYDVVAGLAAQALSKLGTGAEDCVIEIAPDLAGPVSERMRSEASNVRIEANETLGEMGCRVRSGEGVIVADLETQLQTLRERWGLSRAAGGQV